MKIAITDKKKTSFLKAINIITLSTYALLLIIQMRRYFYSDFNIHFFKAGFLCYGILALVCCFKIIYYLHDFPLYSLLSSNILILSFWLCSYKSHYSMEELMSHWPALLTTLLLIVSVKQILADYVVKTFFATVGSIYVVRIFMSTILDIPSVMTCLKTGEGLELGFGNHNFPMVLFFFLVLSWIYISRNRKNRLVNAFVILVLTVILAALTRSKTSTLLLIITIAIIIVQSLINCNILNANANIIRQILKASTLYALFSPMILVLVSFIGTIAYNIHMQQYGSAYELYRGTSTFLSRFDMLSFDFAFNGIKLPFQFVDSPYIAEFANFSPITGGTTFMPYSDNVCHYIIIQYGYIVSVLSLLLSIYVSILAYKRYDISFMIIIGLTFTFCIMERSSLLYYANPFLIVAFSSFHLKNNIPQDRIDVLA